MCATFPEHKHVLKLGRHSFSESVTSLLSVLDRCTRPVVFTLGVWSDKRLTGTLQVSLLSARSLHRRLKPHACSRSEVVNHLRSICWLASLCKGQHFAQQWLYRRIYINNFHSLTSTKCPECEGLYYINQKMLQLFSHSFSWLLTWNDTGWNSRTCSMWPLWPQSHSHQNSHWSSPS